MQVDDELKKNDAQLNQALIKMSIDKTAIELDVKSAAKKLPTSSSVTKENIRLSRNFVHALERASAEMAVNGDEYIAIDAFLMGNLNQDPFKEILEKYGEPKFISLLHLSLNEQKFDTAFRLIYKIEFKDYFHALINDKNYRQQSAYIMRVSE